jgi:hypothetical protein
MRSPKQSEIDTGVRDLLHRDERSNHRRAATRLKFGEFHMSDHSGLADLVGQVRDASRSIEASDTKMGQRLDGIERSLNELYIKTQRPVGYSADCDEAHPERYVERYELLRACTSIWLIPRQAKY